MKDILIRNAKIINRGAIKTADILIHKGFIEKIEPSISQSARREIDAAGNHVFPGIIDDQVHFREPGLTHKADIHSESRAAVAGGVTSFMEMPNTAPPTLTQELLEAKYAIAARNSLANYSFFMGASNDNLEAVKRTNPKTVCGIKAFMGSSTGNMLVDNPTTLEHLFAESPMLIATHCEDETTIRARSAAFKTKYGANLSAKHHPQIRNAESCYLSSALAVQLARKYNTRLHILHISTARELALFDNQLPLEKKRITAEVCVHHLYFHSGNYAQKGNLIQCNPAIKSRANRDALFPALLDNRLDIIATDHAPHTLEEKNQPYGAAPSGLPLVQHSLNVMLEFYHKGKISLERIAEKMCHSPAICFQVDRRGFVDEGCWADLSIVDIEKRWTVTAQNTLYKCGWSPFEGHRFKGKVLTTVVSGHVAWHNDHFFEEKAGERLLFAR